MAKISPFLYISQMKVLEDLDAEHRLLEQAAGSFVRFARGEAAQWDDEKAKALKKFTVFFDKFMVQYHTKKEEDVIFQFFAKTGLPSEKGPIYYYELEHKAHAQTLLDLEKFAKGELSGDEQKELVQSVERFCGDVWEHIDKEDSVVFPEVEERIRGALRLEQEKAVTEFDIAKEELLSARSEGEELVKRYPPVEMLDDVFRGDGCMSCRYYGDGCEGIEHEWWTEHEWEDFFARNNRD